MNRSQRDDIQPGVDQRRINTFIIIIAVIFLVYLSRLITFQVLEHEEWLAAAEENRTNTISTPTQRGVIFDRNGIILAQNIASYNIAITPAALPDDEGEIGEG